MTKDKISRNSFTSALDENQKVVEQFRDLMHDTFDGIYAAMGKKNFLRWINTRKISDRIKKLVVEEFDKEDLEKHSNAAGYYTPGTNRERLREGYINQNVARHETLHFFTDNYFVGETFPTFIDEGLTEYLNREFEKSNTGSEQSLYSYAQNVDFVEILHNIIGDSLIRVYLTGTSTAFMEEFASYITEDGTENIVALDRMYDALNRVHDVLHSRSNPETAEEQKRVETQKRDVMEKDYPELRQVVINMVANAIRKKAHDLEYYVDGKLDMEAVINDFKVLLKKASSLLEKNDTFGMRSLSKKEKIQWIECALRSVLTAVLQESHIPNDKIQGILDSSIEQIGEGSYVGAPKIKRETLNEAIEHASGPNITKDLIDKRLENKRAYRKQGQCNITAFLMDVSLILDKMNVETDSRKLFLDFAAYNYLPADINRDLVKKLIVKHSKLYSALYQKMQDNKRNVVDSKFVKISGTKFIEKRDQKVYFLEYDEEMGTFSENEMTTGYGIASTHFSKKTIEKFGETVKRMTYLDRKTGHTITYSVMMNEDFSVVTVNGKEYEVMASPEKLGDSFFIDEAMKPVLDGIENNRYVSVLKDGEELVQGVDYTGLGPDTGSRIIYYKLFLEELRNSVSNIPEKFRGNIEKSVIGYLIARTYWVNPENIAELQNYIRSLSLESISNENTIQKLYGFTEELNQARRSFVEQESRYSAISFPDEDARRRWKESLKAKKRRKKDIEFNQDIDAFVMTDSMSCILEPLKVQRHEDHYSAMEGVRYPSGENVRYRTAAAEKVDYEAFCDKLKGRLDDIEEGKKSEFVKKVIEKSLNNWYGNAYGCPDNDTIDDERWEVESELVRILTNRIMDNTEVDMARVKEIEKRLLELSREKVAICKRIVEKRNPIKFENPDVEKYYKFVKWIHEDESIPEETKKLKIQELKAESKTALEGKRKMNAFARLALSGKNPPSTEDIKRASKMLDFYIDKGMDR